jgi:hypothetical protein
MGPVTDPPTPGAAEATPPVASRRTRRGRADVFPDASAPPVRRYVMAFSTMALSALIGLSAFAGDYLLAGAVAVTALCLAVAWHPLLGLSRSPVPGLLLSLGGLAAVAVVQLTTSDPFLRNLPVVVAGALVLVFLHQLVRKPPRDQLTESIAASVAGVALVCGGAAFLPLTHTLDGREVLAAGLAAVGAGSLGDLLVGRGSMHTWQLPISMLLGGWAAVAVSVLAQAPPIAHAALLGFLVAAVSHAVRRVLAPHPLLATVAGQVCAAAASILSVGIVVYAFARLVVG